jgi:lipopolysaccharide transport system ATP-binding protein
MDDVAQTGRTVVFVSHNMGLLQQLCERGIFLQQGAVHTDGTIAEAVDAYLHSLEQARSLDISQRTDRKGQGKVRLIGAEVTNKHNGSPAILKTGHPARFVFQLNTLVPGMACNFNVYDTIGQPVTSFKSRVRGPQDKRSRKWFEVCLRARWLCYARSVSDRCAIIGDDRLQDFIGCHDF